MDAGRAAKLSAKAAIHKTEAKKPRKSLTKSERVQENNPTMAETEAEALRRAQAELDQEREEFDQRKKDLTRKENELRLAHGNLTEEVQRAVQEQAENRHRAISADELRDSLKFMAETLTSKKPDPPIFKGEKGEDPTTHTLLMKDWKEHCEYTKTILATKFPLSLRGKARLWYDDLPKDLSYNELEERFILKYNSTCHVKRDLAMTWESLKFDHTKQEIMDFIRQVKEIARLLGKNDTDIVRRLKDSMPTQVYFSILQMKNLPEIVECLEEIFESSRHMSQLGSSATTPTTQAITTKPPLFAIEEREQKQVSFALDQSKQMSQLIEQVTNLCAVIDQKSEKPYKPYPPRDNSRYRNPRSDSKSYSIDRPRRSDSRDRSRRSDSRDRYSRSDSWDRFSGSDSRDRNNRDRQPRDESRDRYRDRDRYQNRDQSGDRRENRQYQNSERSFSRDKPQSYGNNSRYSPRQPIEMRNVRCFSCSEFGHYARNCEKNQTFQPINNYYDENNSRGDFCSDYNHTPPDQNDNPDNMISDDESENERDYEDLNY